MKNIFAFLFAISFALHLSAQEWPRDTTGLKSVHTYNGKKLCGITEYDKSGNCIFTKSDDMSGPVSMLWSITYDSLNREIFSISAHSNLGFYVSETVYEPLCKKIYVYMIDSIYRESGFYFGTDSHDLIYKISSKKELDSCDKVRELLKGKKYLKHITWYNNQHKEIKEVSLNEKGDTSTLQLFSYNEWGKESSFHYESRNSMKATWDYYGVFDKNGNRLQWVRVDDQNGIKDTSEVTECTFSETNQLLSRTELRHGRFQYREVYEYNEKDQVVRELDYNNGPSNLTATIIYSYDKNGKPTKKVMKDHPDEMHPAYHYKVKRTYWKK